MLIRLIILLQLLIPGNRPPIDDYLEQIPELSSFSPDQRYNELLRLMQVIEYEIFTFYLDDLDWQSLLQIYRRFDERLIGHYADLPAISLNTWVQHILQKWLDANPTDFNITPTITFEHFTVTAEAMDFDLDGQTEWILTINDDFRGGYEAYFILSANHQVFNNGTPWSTGQERPNTPAGMTIRLSSIEDFTGDGTLEWWLEYYMSSSMIGVNFTISTTGYLLDWENDQLIELAQISNPQSLQNIDDDPALEIITDTSGTTDNFGCGYNISKMYDWDGFSYQEQTYTTLTDCTVHFAEEAMWRYEFGTAIEFYNQYLDSRSQDYAETREIAGDLYADGFTYRYEYFLARRLIALYLDGNSEAFEQSRAELANEFYFYDNAFLRLVLETASDDLCQAAYDYFDNYRVDDFTRFFVGEIYNTPIDTSQLYYPTINQYQAGCDIRLFTDEIPATPTYSPTLYPPTPREETTPVQHPYPTFTPQPFYAANRLYWQALELEASGDYAAASEIYQTIAYTYPDTILGALAALHHAD